MSALQLAVLGDPIAHSKSPVIHAAAYRALGLEWRYRAIRCGETPLESFLAGRGPEWRGLSLTMPLKDEAHRLAHSLDATARDSGVVNTLLRLDDSATGEPGAPEWAGFNTDVAGLARAIARAGLDATRTVVLGAGATAGSAVLAARSLGATSVTVMARRIEAAHLLAERFDGTQGPADRVAIDAATLGSAYADPTLVISTLPGHGVNWDELSASAGGAPLFDVAYNPWPSAGAQAWSAAGGAVHSGIDMLVEQALIQVRIFTTGDPELPLPDEERVLEAMRSAAA